MIIPFDKMANIENRSKKFRKIEKIIIWISSIYIWIAGAVLIYFVFLKITGHSPEAIDILIVSNTIILAAMLGGGLTIGTQLGKFNRVVKQFDSFSRDFKKHLEIEHGRKVNH